MMVPTRGAAGSINGYSTKDSLQALNPEAPSPKSWVLRGFGGLPGEREAGVSLTPIIIRSKGLAFGIGVNGRSSPPRW